MAAIETEVSELKSEDLYERKEAEIDNENEEMVVD